MKKARTLVVVNPKGGSGKTTISVNLANHIAYNTKKTRVLLTDADPQESIMLIQHEQNQADDYAGYTIEAFSETSPSKWARYLEGRQGLYDYHIIDTAGNTGLGERAALLNAADALVIPFTMRQKDVVVMCEFLEDLEVLLHDKTKPILGVVNLINQRKEQADTAIIEGMAGLQIVGGLRDRVQYMRFQNIGHAMADKEMNKLMKTILKKL